MLRKFYRKLYQNLFYNIYGSVTFLGLFILATYVNLPLLPSPSRSVEGFADILNSIIDFKPVMFTLYFAVALVISPVLLTLSFPRFDYRFLFIRAFETISGVFSLFCIMLLDILALSIIGVDKISPLGVAGLWLECFAIWHCTEWILINRDLCTKQPLCSRHTTKPKKNKEWQ